MPKGSDESWVGKLVEKCSKYKHFDKPRFGTNCKLWSIVPFVLLIQFQSFRVAFFVKHFSDTVQYDSFSFLEKNRDTVSKELVKVLRESDMDFLRKLMELDDFDDSKQNKTNSPLGGRVVISASKSLVSLNIVDGCQRGELVVLNECGADLIEIWTSFQNTTPGRNRVSFWNVLTVWLHAMVVA